MSILSRLPRHKNNIFYNIVIYILTLAAMLPLFIPVILANMSDNILIDTENGHSVAYIYLRFAFIITLVLALFATSVYKQYIISAIPAALGLSMALIKLLFYIDKYKAHKRHAEILHQSIENNISLKYDSIYILMFSLFILLCVSLILYLTGVPHTGIFVLLFSITSAICAAFVLFTEIDTCEVFIENSMTSAYDKLNVLEFAYTVPVTLAPSFMILNSVPYKRNENKTSKRKKSKYTPKRMKS